MDNITEIWKVDTRQGTLRDKMIELERTAQQMREYNERWNSRALSGQTVRFTKLYKDAAGVYYWTGSITSAEGATYAFEKLNAYRIVTKSKKRGMLFTVREASRKNDLLAGVFGRTSIERDEAAQKVLSHIKEYIAADRAATLIQWDEEATLAEVQAALYAADAEAKPQHRETQVEKMAREKAEALEQYKRQMIARLIATGMSEAEAKQLVNQN